MKVLIACEFSGIVRSAFRSLGHEAYSCDILPAEDKGEHIQGNVINHLNDGFDLMIAHPPCTYLARSGASWSFRKLSRLDRQEAALDFVQTLLEASIPRIALENPIGAISTHLCKPDQIIHPWQFGHGETKATCLWLKNLPLLKPTSIVTERNSRILNQPERKNRKADRSRTLTGIAQAMASQWGV